MSAIGCLGWVWGSLQEHILDIYKTPLQLAYIAAFIASDYFIIHGPSPAGIYLFVFAFSSGIYLIVRTIRRFDEHQERLRQEYAERQKQGPKDERQDKKEQKDPYVLAHNTLGIHFGASLSEIKRAYRIRAKQCHPDLGGNEEEFMTLNWAYNFLLGK